MRKLNNTKQSSPAVIWKLTRDPVDQSDTVEFWMSSSHKNEVKNWVSMDSLNHGEEYKSPNEDSPEQVYMVWDDEADFDDADADLDEKDIGTVTKPKESKFMF